MLGAAFTYRFTVESADQTFLRRISEDAKSLGHETSLVENQLQITGPLEALLVERRTIFSKLGRSTIRFSVDQDNVCLVTVENLSKRTFYRTIFGLTVVLSLLASIASARYQWLPGFLAILLLLYVLASRIPSTGEFRRLKKYLNSKRD